MYAIAEQDLKALLMARTYSSLASVPAYQKLFVGGKPDAQLCAQAARTTVSQLASSGGVYEFGTRQPVQAQVWTGELCRAIGPGSRVDGPWWFDCEMPSKRRDKVIKALRPMLAVCRDWNDFLSLVTFRPGADGIPVLTGQGRSQPTYSSRSPKYDAKETVVFIGGFQQVFVPFVPSNFIVPYF